MRDELMLNVARHNKGDEYDKAYSDGVMDFYNLIVYGPEARLVVGVEDEDEETEEGQ